MVVVPAGPFTMGCAVLQERECSGHERPQHQVYLDVYFIDRTEVTVADYAACHHAGACSAAGLNRQHDLGGEAVECNWGRTGRDRHPINCVDWSEAQAYCQFAGKRLPTEAEWEKAARGTDGRIYPWGNEPADGREDLVVTLELRDTSLRQHPPHLPYINSTWPVGSRPAGKSPFGTLDMLGNVWEWTADWYDAKLYTPSPRRNPTGPTSGSFRVVRGDVNPSFMRNSQRNRLAPGTRLGVLGLRCAWSP